jgi:transposase-like protein
MPCVLSLEIKRYPAKAMLKDSDITVAAVARRLNVVASTLYRHIPHARSASLEANHDTGIPATE